MHFKKLLKYTKHTLTYIIKLFLTQSKIVILNIRIQHMHSIYAFKSRKRLPVLMFSLGIYYNRTMSTLRHISAQNLIPSFPCHQFAHKQNLPDFSFPTIDAGHWRPFPSLIAFQPLLTNWQLIPHILSSLIHQSHRQGQPIH